jgi:hypothetical protein
VPITHSDSMPISCAHNCRTRALTLMCSELPHTCTHSHVLTTVAPRSLCSQLPHTFTVLATAAHMHSLTHARACVALTRAHNSLARVNKPVTRINTHVTRVNTPVTPRYFHPLYSLGHYASPVCSQLPHTCTHSHMLTTPSHVSTHLSLTGTFTHCTDCPTDRWA